MLDPFIMSLFARMTPPSRGRVFGGIGFLWALLFFAWSVALGKILTMDNLRKQHVIVVDWCCICKMDGDSMDLLLHCEVAYALLNAIFSRVRLTWVMPSWVVDLLVGRGYLVALKVQLCGRWCLLAFCSVFWRKKMIEVLRIASLFSSILFTFGQLLLSFLMCLVFMIFFSFFFFFFFSF
jgi:hypothetical protein